MRPQQNRRMRGRGGNNNNNNNTSSHNNGGGRKGPNPLTRSYESNGPDVKIRGSAQQIAEKYTTLARDAQSSGDRVMAENYLQHAEHYNRIIMAAQAQMPQPQVRDTRDDDEDMDEDGEDGFNQGAGNEQPAQQEQPQRNNERTRERRNDRNNERNYDRNNDRDNGSGPQPVIEGVPAEVALKQADMATEVSGVVAEQASAPAQEAPVQDAAGQDEGEAAVPARKPRRPRRSRVKAGEEASAEGEATAGSDEPVTEAAQ